MGKKIHIEAGRDINFYYGVAAERPASRVAYRIVVGTAVVFLATLVMIGWYSYIWPILCVLPVGFAGCAVVWGAVMLVLQYHRKRRAIAARAEHQNDALLRGDIRTGVYGQYPPA